MGLLCPRHGPLACVVNWLRHILLLASLREKPSFIRRFLAELQQFVVLLEGFCDLAKVLSDFVLLAAGLVIKVGGTLYYEFNLVLCICKQ